MHHNPCISHRQPLLQCMASTPSSLSPWPSHARPWSPTELRTCIRQGKATTQSGPPTTND